MGANYFFKRMLLFFPLPILKIEDLFCKKNKDPKKKFYKDYTRFLEPKKLGYTKKYV